MAPNQPTAPKTIVPPSAPNQPTAPKTIVPPSAPNQPTAPKTIVPPSAPNQPTAPKTIVPPSAPNQPTAPKTIVPPSAPNQPTAPKTIVPPSAPNSADVADDQDDVQTEATPGHKATQVPGTVPPGASSEMAEEIARLKAELAAKDAQLSRTAPQTPNVVYEPETTHGRDAIANSKHRHLTSVQLQALINRGKAQEPETAVLCANGYYTPRRTRG